MCRIAVDSASYQITQKVLCLILTRNGVHVQIEGPVGIFGLDETIHQWVPKKQNGQFGMGRRNCAHLKPEVQVRTCWIPRIPIVWPYATFSFFCLSSSSHAMGSVSSRADVSLLGVTVLRTHQLHWV
jgi:hypothetical protein